MKFLNGNLFINGSFHQGSFEVRAGRFVHIQLEDGGTRASRRESTDPIAHNQDIAEKAPVVSSEMTDLAGAMVIPGLIDLHSHGNSGYDFSTCSQGGLEEMARYLAKNGITSFAPASMTMPYDALAEAFSHARKLHDMQQENRSCGTSRLVGVNMEGPYFSYGKRGAQNPAYLKNPDLEGFRKLYEISGELIRLVDVAPELPGAIEFIREASQLCTVSVAHTEADYETVRNAFATGASHVTHLFNGMNGIGHRSPGPVSAAFDTPGIYVELICDGIHILPPVIRMVFQLFPGRVILISDALACCGMPDGHYQLGEQEITLKNSHATLPDGTLAGSASNLFQMLQNVVSFGIPLEEAIRSATWNPAHQLGMEHEIGSIEEDKKADFLILSESLQLQSVYLGGKLI